MQRGISILMLCFCLSASYSTKAIDKPTLRHVQGFQGIEARGGMAIKGFYACMDYSYYLSRSWYFKCGLGWEINEDRDEQTSFLSLLVQPILAYTLFDFHDRIYTNVLMGTVMAYEMLARSGQKKRENSFNVGIATGFELECFIMQHTALLVSLIPRWLFLGEYQNPFDGALEVGLKLTF